MIERITPLILTYDEAPNIHRTLERLKWGKDIVVVDSGSTDDTPHLLRKFSNVNIHERKFTSHAEQWTFGLEKTGIQTEWVLALDADYVLSEELIREMESLDPRPDVAGYRASFVYCINGKPLRSGIYPPVVVLFRRAKARYVQDGHTQRVLVEGRIEELKGRIFHDDRKPLSSWLAAQARYMRLEARRLLAARRFSDLGFTGRLRRLIVVAPAAMFVYCLILRGGILDGRAGLFYALQRTVAEAILSLYLLQASLGIDIDD